MTTLIVLQYNIILYIILLRVRLHRNYYNSMDVIDVLTRIFNFKIFIITIVISYYKFFDVTFAEIYC